MFKGFIPKRRGNDEIAMIVGLFPSLQVKTGRTW